MLLALLVAAGSIFSQYNEACAEAKAGHKDKALAIVEQVAVAGVFDRRQFENDPDFASIKDEPRFKAAVAKADETAHPCRRDPHAHEFDFWIGEWDVTNGGKKAGTSKVEAILDGCVLLENWSSASGHAGKSFNIWDGAAKEWRQTWVNDQGQLTEYRGRFESGELRFEAKGLRMTFSKNADGSVRQFIETTNDGGKTWTPSFDGKYVRRKSS